MKITMYLLEKIDRYGGTGRTGGEREGEGGRGERDTTAHESVCRARALCVCVCAPQRNKKLFIFIYSCCDRLILTETERGGEEIKRSKG